MITTTEIKQKAGNLYIQVLRSTLEDTPLFPLNIRSDKSLSKDFVSMSREIAQVISESKDRRGFGYRVVSEQVKSKHHGIQDIPKAILFETRADYLKYIGKADEFAAFTADVQNILTTFPQLNSWCVKNSLSVISNSGNWPHLLKVCSWFFNEHEPNRYYIRELPIDLHTKFIESNVGILKLLLDELIPHLSKTDELIFQKRFGLRYQEPQIRVRFLDESLAVESRFTDISLPLSDFVKAGFQCQRVLITENLMNFLTLPKLQDAIAVWGGGYAVKNLSGIDWLKEKEIFYWGDIDVHGFEILSQLRSYYGHAISFMMDNETFDGFSYYVGTGSKSNVKSLPLLTQAESDLFGHLKLNDLRLEQEKIPQKYVDNYIRSILKP